MKTRLFLITLLMLASGPAYAEWLEITGIDKLGVTIYVDPDTIRQKGNIVKWWELRDFKTIQTVGGSSYLSVKIQIEYDCEEERIRHLAITEFSGNMGDGKPVWSMSDAQKWEPVQPDSVGQILWKYACGKKQSGAVLP